MCRTCTQVVRKAKDTPNDENETENNTKMLEIMN